MSRLLFLLPSVPEPLDSGAKIRNYGLLKLLSAEHAVDAIAFGDSDPALAGLTGRCALVAPPRLRSRVQRAVDLGRSDLPDMAQRLWSHEFANTLGCFLRARDYDVVQAEGIEMARYLWMVDAEQRVYDAHNAEFLLQRRLAASGSMVARLYSRVQWRRLERFERGVVRQSRLTLAVSNHDANQLAALADLDATVRVVPNAIDVAAYPFRAENVGTSDLLFIGKLDYRPNHEALRWFIHDVIPQIGPARLFVVGANPPRWLVQAGQHSDRIAVTGYVHDERRYLARAAAFVLPVLTGAGSRLKALIAMASGVPIVSTKLGMEGLEAEPNTHFLVAESAGEWANAIRLILDDRELAQTITSAARTLVEQRYDWSAIQADVREAYAFLN